MIRSTALVLSCLLAVPWSGPAQEVKPWKAGVAKIKITPEQLMWMSGYGGRNKPAEGKLTELWAKALVLEDPAGSRGLLITLDLVGIDRKLSQQVCSELTKKHGLPRQAIILSTSHTHCGPVVEGNLDTMYDLDATQQKYVADYAQGLRQKLVQVADEALAGMMPVHVTWGIGHVGFAVNRRNNKEPDVPKMRTVGKLKGPFDHDVPVLAVRDLEGRLVAVTFGYACHATVLSFYQWCGDYPGFAQESLEKAYPGAVALFWAGCGADQNPLPRRSVEMAKDYGRRLAEAVQNIVDAPMNPLDGGLAMAYTEIDLPFSDLPTRDKLAEDTRSKNKYIAGRARNLLKQMERQGSLKASYPYPVQTWQLGRHLHWVTLGGEVVVDFSLRLKKEIFPGRTWVMGYANDVMAYIPSLRVLKEGGYEGGTSMVYYGLPTVWGPRAEELIVAAVHAQVKKLGPK